MSVSPKGLCVLEGAPFNLGLREQPNETPYFDTISNLLLVFLKVRAKNGAHF